MILDFRKRKVQISCRRRTHVYPLLFVAVPSSNLHPIAAALSYEKHTQSLLCGRKAVSRSHTPFHPAVVSHRVKAPLRTTAVRSLFAPPYRARAAESVGPAQRGAAPVSRAASTWSGLRLMFPRLSPPHAGSNKVFLTHCPLRCAAMRIPPAPPPPPLSDSPLAPRTLAEHAPEASLLRLLNSSTAP
ncbi:hypothetical protein PR202_ga09474 [Eleusine coracana subsp. coracana]|uniref:Uncharacterized protein n=1 Tax=Eleusine coracana subsp. coracana TaxID=191504 RepID=A0AAV5C4R2_ELECO|nr:hypothetical protein PR202_ga09474 [Eleusine coracana subsp. coracana]